VVTIIPVLEEVLVVERRLLIKEELRITRHVTRELVETPVPIRRQRAMIERAGPDGAFTPSTNCPEET
jgi:stress response protein YsnF